MKSPFKVLDAYTKKDAHFFFGREDEIEELYHRVFKSNLLLVYGASGTGKTSLIQCGLSTKFSDDNWFSLHVRRRDNINKSLLAAIENTSITKISKEDLDPSEPEILQRVEGLYFDFFKPIYLIFDQLEELFILGSEDEQLQFYSQIKKLIDSKLHCRIFLIIREEYIAHLSKMEERIPTLFDNRIRIERMRKREVKEVVEKSCEMIPSIEINEKQAFLDEVLNNLSEDNLTVELTHLQVYLDKLYRASKVEGGIHYFDVDLLQSVGKVEDVLGGFLEEQIQKLGNTELAWKILKVFITKNGTKRSASLEEIYATLKNQNYRFNKQDIQTYLKHFVSAKILTPVEQLVEVYEFTHDSLANKTFEKLDVKERNLIEIASLVKQQYEIYKSRGLLMNQENLVFVTPFLKDLHLEKEHSQFINKSIREMKRKRNNRIAIVSTVVFILLLLSIAAIWQANDAQKAREVAVQEKEKAEDALKSFTEEENKRKTLEVNDIFEKVESYLKAGFEEAALKELDSIRLIDNRENIQKRINEIKTKYDL